MGEPCLPHILFPFKAGVTHQRKTVPTGGGKFPKRIPATPGEAVDHPDSPVPSRSPPILCPPAWGRWLPAALGPFPFGKSAPGNRHIRSLGKCSSVPPAPLDLAPHSKLFPAQGDGIAGDEDELPAIPFKNTGSATLTPAVKEFQA